MVLKYLKHLKKRWYIFLIVFVVIAGLSYIAQAYSFSQEKGGTGKVIEVDVYRLINVDVTSLESSQTGDVLEYDMSQLWTRSTLLSELADYYTENYDMETVCPGWNNLALRYQVEWIKDKFELYHVSNSMVYEIRFYREIAESEKATMQPMMESMMDDYVNKAMESVSLVEKNLRYDIVKDHTYIRDGIVEAENTFRVKEALLSIMLGLLGSLFVMTILFVKEDK